MLSSRKVILGNIINNNKIKNIPINLSGLSIIPTAKEIFLVNANSPRDLI